MASYKVFVSCGECGNPHSTQLQVTLDEGLDRANLAELFAETPPPSAIVFMQSNKYLCPHTKGLYSANDLSKAFLVAE